MIVYKSTCIDGATAQEDVPCNSEEEALGFCRGGSFHFEICLSEKGSKDLSAQFQDVFAALYLAVTCCLIAVFEAFKKPGACLQ